MYMQSFNNHMQVALTSANINRGCERYLLELQALVVQHSMNTCQLGRGLDALVIMHYACTL